MGRGYDLALHNARRGWIIQQVELKIVYVEIGIRAIDPAVVSILIADPAPEVSVSLCRIGPSISRGRSIAVGDRPQIEVRPNIGMSQGIVSVR